jgi:aspartate racemase
VPKHIGIAAVSPEGSAICYRQIGRRASEIESPERRPLITLHNRPFSSYVEAIHRQDWTLMADMLRESAAVLHEAGADFCVLPDNVAHHALPMAETGSPIPWLNMIDLVAEAIQSNGCKTVGLIGTRFVTYGSTYQTVLGLRGMHLHVPPENDADDIDRIIFTEAVLGRVRRDSRDRVIGAIQRLADRGCEAVILGATEASLLFAVEESPLPTFDPVELLAEAAIRHALADDVAPQPASA